MFGPEGADARHITRLSVWTDELQGVRAIEVHLHDGEARMTKIGDETACRSALRKIDMPIDGQAGERITAMDAYHMKFGWLLAFTVS